MPSAAHEVLTVALREQPTLLAALIATLTGATLARGLAPVDAAVRFVKTAEVRPDLLFLSRRRHWAIVELQRRRDPAKRRRWLLAASVLLDQTRILGDVIIITARSDVATWARTVAHLRSDLGTELALTPVVLHLDEEAARKLLDEGRPELALFAAWAVHHRHGARARAVVERAFDLTFQLPVGLQRAQWDAILSVLSDRMFAQLRETAMNPDKIPLSPAARKFKQFMADLGRKEGRVEGKQEAVLAVLKARGITVSATARAAILGCTDPATLDAWVVRAASATSSAEVVAPAARPRAARAPKRAASPARKSPARRPRSA